MSRTVDPLQILKDYFNNNKTISREKDYLILKDGSDNIRLKLDTPTALVRSQTNKQYTLGCLWFFLVHRLNSLKSYIKQCQDEGLESVNSIDKEKITDFFINNKEVDILDNYLKPKTLITLGKKRKGDDFIEALASEFNGGNEKGTSKSEREERSARIQAERKKLEELDPNFAIMNYIYKNEKKSLNRNSMLKPINNHSSFENLLYYSARIFTKGNVQKQNETLSFLEELRATDGLRGNKAIIVVPSAFIEGNICFENAKEFLFNSNYINLKTCSEEERNKCYEDCKKNSFNKSIHDKELLFEICSNVRSFTKNEWKRIVCVFVQGDDWEFKDWPKDETITSILEEVKGFHLKYQDLPLNENVKKWNVKVLEISRTKRHFDVSIQNEFWYIMTEFLSQPRKRRIIPK